MVLVAIKYKSTANSPQVSHGPELGLSVELIESILCIDASRDIGVTEWILVGIAGFGFGIVDRSVRRFGSSALGIRFLGSGRLMGDAGGSLVGQGKLLRWLRIRRLDPGLFCSCVESLLLLLSRPGG